MKLTSKIKVFFSQKQQKHLLLAEIPTNLVDKLSKLVDKDCTVEVKEKRKERSLTANAYLWSLTDKLSKKLGNSLGNQYVMAIKDYGQFIKGMVLTEEAYSEFEKSWNKKATDVPHTISMVTVTNRFKSKGVHWVEVIIFKGSSEYDSKEFSTLIEGVIQDCKDQNIETLPVRELKKMMEEYDD